MEKDRSQAAPVVPATQEAEVGGSPEPMGNIVSYCLKNK
jgi:hypothetical protein